MVGEHGGEALWCDRVVADIAHARRTARRTLRELMRDAHTPHGRNSRRIVEGTSSLAAQLWGAMMVFIDVDKTLARGAMGDLLGGKNQ